MNESVILLPLDCGRSWPEHLNASSPFESSACLLYREIVGANCGNGGGVSKCT